eukprot:Gb_29307 [translate_table: standard]
MAPEVPPEGFTGKVATLNSNEYSKRAYVTFLAGSGDYVKGVIGLAKGLRKVKSSYPLVVAVLPDVPQDHRSQLHNQGCIVHEIEPINPPENQVQFAMAYYVLNYSKLRIWEFEEYSKMGSKPWRFTGKEENMEREDIKRLVEKWWDIYNDSSLDFKPTDRIPEAETRSDVQQMTANSLRAAMPSPVRAVPAPPAA